MCLKKLALHAEAVGAAVRSWDGGVRERDARRILNYCQTPVPAVLEKTILCLAVRRAIPS